MVKFKDYPDFTPDLTPIEVLKAGAFGGSYFKRPEDAPPPLRQFVGGSYDKNNNMFKVDASLSREWWKEKGLIKDPDPLGWFQWYSWFWYGRRIPGYDEWQIGRWRKFVRHKAQILKALEKSPERIGDPRFRPRQRQALLHWAYNPFPEDPNLFYKLLDR